MSASVEQKTGLKIFRPEAKNLLSRKPRKEAMAFSAMAAVTAMVGGYEDMAAHVPPHFNPYAAVSASCDEDHPRVGLVFTGGITRIGQALLFLKLRKIDKIHISGMEGYPERMAIRMGLSPAEINQDISTDDAPHTEQNGEYSAAWLRTHPACEVVLFTEEFHMARAGMWQEYWMKKDGVNIHLLSYEVPNQPFPHKIIPQIQYLGRRAWEPVDYAISEARILMDHGTQHVQRRNLSQGPAFH